MQAEMRLVQHIFLKRRSQPTRAEGLPQRRGPRGRGAGALAGERTVVDQDCGIDRAVQDRGAEAGEERAAVEQDEVELAAKAGHDDRPAGAGEELARTPDRSAEWEQAQVVVGGVVDRIGQSMAIFDHVVEPHLGTETELPGEHRAGEIGIHEQAPPRPPRQGTGQGQDQRRPSLGAVAAREEDDLQVLLVTDGEQGVRQSLEPLPELPFHAEDRRRPLEPDRPIINLGLGFQRRLGRKAGGKEAPRNDPLGAIRARCPQRRQVRGRGNPATLGNASLIGAGQRLVNFPHEPVPRHRRRAEDSPGRPPEIPLRHTGPRRRARSRSRSSAATPPPVAARSTPRLPPARSDCDTNTGKAPRNTGETQPSVPMNNTT